METMITANYADHQTPQFRVLSQAQCRELYLASLECLERIGVLVHNAEARELLQAAGATVEGERVRIPAHIVHDALAATPGAFTFWGRDARRAIHVAPDHVHFGPGLTNTYFMDPETGERRPVRRGDPGLTARVCDALEHIDYVMGLGLVGDVHARLAPVFEFAELVANTGKPILAWAYNRENLAHIYRIAVAAAGSEDALRRRPFFGLFATFPAPLQHTDDDLGNVLWAAERGLPIVYMGGPSVGLSSPVTGASALVIYLAGALSGLAVAQLKRRGTPVVIGTVLSAMDLRTARPAYGGPEMSLYCAAASDLARYLQVPFMGTAGASESKLLDSQAAIESAVQVLMSALSGAALVHDVGFLDCAEIGSLPLVVMSDEIISLVQRIMRGVKVNRETIMLDLIEEVGPGGHFAAEPRSASICRQEIWLPTLMDRAAYTLWQGEGGKSMEERVAEKLQRILQSHEPLPLPEGAGEQIAAILAEAEAEMHLRYAGGPVERQAP